MRFKTVCICVDRTTLTKFDINKEYFIFQFDNSIAKYLFLLEKECISIDGGRFHYSHCCLFHILISYLIVYFFSLYSFVSSNRLVSCINLFLQTAL